MNNQTCPFCSIPQSRVISQNESVIAIYDSFPVTQGHCLIISKRHVNDWFELTEQERRDAESIILILRHEIMLKDSTVSGFNIGTNCGVSAGQSVMHAHIHLMPRRDGDLNKPEGGVRGVIPGKMKYL